MMSPARHDAFHLMPQLRWGSGVPGGDGRNGVHYWTPGQR